MFGSNNDDGEVSTTAVAALLSDRLAKLSDRLAAAANDPVDE